MGEDILTPQGMAQRGSHLLLMYGYGLFDYCPRVYYLDVRCCDYFEAVMA